MTPELLIEGAIATITLRRPHQGNRLDNDDLAALAAHIRHVNARDEVLVVRLEATGRYFCTGFNIAQISDQNAGNFEAIANALEDMRPVTIAVLQGGVYGGATDLALACDFRVGASDIAMFMPAARLGLHFYARGMQRFVSRLGVDAAKRLFLTAQEIKASEMSQIGFLTQQVDAELLQPTVDALTDKIAAMAPIALLGMKKHLNLIARAAHRPEDVEQDVRRSIQSQDIREGQAAWADKRPPRFQGC